HDGTNARDRLEPPERVGEPGPLLLRQLPVECRHLLARAAPQGPVLRDVRAELTVLAQGRKNLGPARLTPEAAAEPAEAGAAEQGLHRADLRALCRAAPASHASAVSPRAGRERSCGSSRAAAPCRARTHRA